MKLLDKYKNQSLLINTAKLSFSNLIMYVLPIIVTPILSRLYSPACFGEWGVFSSTITIATIVLFLSLENTIVKAEEYEIPHILILCLLIGTLLSGLFLAIIQSIGGLSSCTNIVYIIYFIAYLIYALSYNLNNRYAQYTHLSFSNIIQGGSQALFRIALACIIITSVNGLILGTTIAECITALFLSIKILPKITNYKWRECSVNKLKHTFLKHKNFPLYDAPANLLAFSALSLPTIILAIYYSKSEIGCLSIIFQLLLMPMSLIGSAIGKVYYQELCQNGNNINKTKKVTKSLLRLLSILSILPLLFICCGGDKLIVLFLGQEWQTAGSIAICLSLWSFPIVLTQPLLPIFRVKDKQKTQLYFDLLYFILGIGSLVICSYNSLSIYTTLFCFSVACAISKLALFKKILSLSRCTITKNRIAISVWCIGIIILSIRFYLLWEK